MYGIGIDIVKISRTEKWPDDETLLDFVFTEIEREDAFMHESPHKHLASVFAAKEAFMKAVGTGWGSGIDWQDIEIIRADNHLSITFPNQGMKRFENNKVFLTASTTGKLVIATVAVE